MPINFNITGEISKREVGLISIILITTIGAILTFEKNNSVSIVFSLLVVGGAVVYFMNFTYNSFKNEYDWIEDKLPLLLLSDELTTASTR